MSPEALAAIIGVFMPLVISLLKRANWPSIVNLGIAGAVSLAVGVATVGVQGDLVIGNVGVVFTSAAAAFTAASAVYKLWFQGTEWNDRLADFPVPPRYPVL